MSTGWVRSGLAVAFVGAMLLGAAGGVHFPQDLEPVGAPSDAVLTDGPAPGAAEAALPTRGRDVQASLETPGLLLVGAPSAAWTAPARMRPARLFEGAAWGAVARWCLAHGTSTSFA